MIFLFFEIIRKFRKFISGLLEQDDPKDRKKNQMQIHDFRRLHIPNLFDQKESKHFLESLARKLLLTLFLRTSLSVRFLIVNG